MINTASNPRVGDRIIQASLANRLHDYGEENSSIVIEENPSIAMEGNPSIAMEGNPSIAMEGNSTAMLWRGTAQQCYGGEQHSNAMEGNSLKWLNTL